MIGLDLSEDMLSVAEKRARDAALRDVMFISGDMCSFELYGTVDAVVCCLDGINHLTTREDVDSCFAMVSRYLNEGGVFLFDVNTPHKFRTVYANNDYILEDEGVMCCWRNRLSKKGDVVDFYLTVFRENEDGSWSREDGVERERAYGRVALENSLKKAGLDLCGIFAGYGFESITESTDRWYFVARKPQKAE
jgi:SAM-dependent methyltransferase